MTALWQPGLWSAGFWQAGFWSEGATTQVVEETRRASSRGLLRGPWLRTDIRRIAPDLPLEEWIPDDLPAVASAQACTARRSPARPRAAREREDILLIF